MDDCHVDRVARALAGAGETRRGVLRLLAGGALGLLAARLGLAGDAEAKKQKRKPERRLERKRSEAKPQGGLHAEGKRRGKKGKKKPKDPPPLPPECRDCTECQMCQDRICVPDSALDGVRCLGSGAGCDYCQAGQCVASDRQPCEDGVCPRAGECCPGKRQCGDQCVPADQCCEDEFKCLPDGPCVGQYDCCPDEGPKKCPDPETARGIYCVDSTVCCVDRERQCGDGSCIPLDACCPEQKRCGPRSCVGQNECCPGQESCADGSCPGEGACCPEQWQCADGSCVAQGECCADERRCPDGSCRSTNQCCEGEKRCADDSCVPEDGCCGGECGFSSVCCQGTCCDRYQGGGIYTCTRDGCCNQWFVCNDGRCDCRCFYDSCDPPELCPDMVCSM
jgi:hypothetical protein